jgi:hypothetical protein
MLTYTSADLAAMEFTVVSGDLVHVHVTTTSGDHWTGAFDGEPTRELIAAAIDQDAFHNPERIVHTPEFDDEDYLDVDCTAQRLRDALWEPRLGTVKMNYPDITFFREMTKE